MPPPIPRAPLRTVSPSTIARLFSTTVARHDEVPAPPESPRFISLPDMPQNDETKRRPVKGHLPVPREIFTKRAHGPHKLSPGFVRDTAPRSRAELRGEPPRSSKAAWRRLMAESRRQALGGGIGSLWRRKVTRETRAKARADDHGRRNLADARAPERLDEVYTRGTVTQATLDTSVVRDPLYEERQRASAARTAALHQARAEGRKDAIQRLYVEASKFIVTEEELAARVDEVFTETAFHKAGSFRGFAFKAENAWEAWESPPTVKDMFAEMKGESWGLMKAFETGSNKTKKRQKIVAGELTGGALSVN